MTIRLPIRPRARNREIYLGGIFREIFDAAYRAEHDLAPTTDHGRVMPMKPTKSNTETVSGFPSNRRCGIVRTSLVHHKNNPAIPHLTIALESRWKPHPSEAGIERGCPGPGGGETEGWT